LAIRHDDRDLVIHMADGMYLHRVDTLAVRRRSAVDDLAPTEDMSDRGPMVQLIVRTEHLPAQANSRAAVSVGTIRGGFAAPDKR
jgi:hypothetical protein